MSVDVYSYFENPLRPSIEVLQYIMNKYYNLKNLVIEKDKYCKPSFKNRPDIHFSISHSHGKLVIAICNKNIAIDIQDYKNIDYPKIIPKILSEDEKNQVKDLESFFELWTKKECLMKYTGKGLTLDLPKYSTNKKIKDYEFKITKYENYILCLLKPINYQIKYIKINSQDLDKEGLTNE